MMKNRKKNYFGGLVSVVLTFAMIFSIVPANVVTTSAKEFEDVTEEIIEKITEEISEETTEIEEITESLNEDEYYEDDDDDDELSGECGDDLLWEIVETDNITVLKIFGTGIMYDYISPENEAPWSDYDFKKVIIYDGVTRIGNNAFSNAKVLENVDLSDTVTEIGSYAFSNCKTLKTIVFNDALKTIGVDAFNGCTSLKSIVFDAGVETIGSGAFTGCDNLVEVTIMNSNVEIGTIALGFLLDDMYQFYLNKNMIIIGYKNSSADIYAKKHFLQFKDINTGILYKNDKYEGTCGERANWKLEKKNGKNILYITGTGSIYDYDRVHEGDNQSPWSLQYTAMYYSSLDIASGIERIGENAFAYQSPEYVTFHNGLKIIGADAFTEGCMETVELPDSVTKLEEGAFYRCMYMKSIKLSNNLKEIGAYAFFECYELKEITIPKSVTKIGDYAFGFDEGIVIKGYKGTVAEKYAKENNITFKALDEEPQHVHTYKTETTKATLTKNGSIKKVCTGCGAVASTETIYYPKTINLSKTSFTYNGKTQKPTISVVDANNKMVAAANYDIKYATGLKNVGAYKVTITFKGNYTGTLTKIFTINPKKTSLVSVKSKPKQMTVKWKKQAAQVTGYEIQYSTNASFKKGVKKVAVTSAKTTSKTIKKLKSGKKYYVRIRTYKTVNGKKYYSRWSVKKTVSIK